jgi:hypothetical protein
MYLEVLRTRKAALVGGVDVEVLQTTLSTQKEPQRGHAVNRPRVHPGLQVMILLREPGITHAEALTAATALVGPMSASEFQKDSFG